MSDDSDSDSQEDHHQTLYETLFKSSLTVGSQFIDVIPDKELIFGEKEGKLFSQVRLKNLCKKGPLAFYIFTSTAQIHIQVQPKLGFIKPSQELDILISMEMRGGNNADATKDSHPRGGRLLEEEKNQ